MTKKVQVVILFNQLKFPPRFLLKFIGTYIARHPNYNSALAYLSMGLQLTEFTVSG